MWQTGACLVCMNDRPIRTRLGWLRKLFDVNGLDGVPIGRKRRRGLALPAFAALSALSALFAAPSPSEQLPEHAGGQDALERIAQLVHVLVALGRVEGEAAGNEGLEPRRKLGAEVAQLCRRAA